MFEIFVCVGVGWVIIFLSIFVVMIIGFFMVWYDFIIFFCRKLCMLLIFYGEYWEVYVYYKLIRIVLLYDIYYVDWLKEFLFLNVIIREK